MNFLKALNDKKFLEENIEHLEKEFQFWMVNRTKEVTVEGDTYKLARYNVEVGEPRPGNIVCQIFSISDRNHSFNSNLRN